MKRILKMRWKQSIMITLPLILLMMIASFMLTGWINKREENDCFKRLREETDTVSQNIELQIKSNQEQLAVLAAVAAQYTNMASNDLWEVLNSYEEMGILSDLEILLPGDILVTDAGTERDVEGFLSYEEEAKSGIHISKRQLDPTRDNAPVLRSYVPVKKDGETAAMLCGVIDLEKFPTEMLASPYGGEAAVYILEGESGDFLLDTWHQGELGNIWALGERKMAPGYNHEQLKQGLTNGESEYVVFVSQTVGEYLYFYYEPMSINDWRIALSVPRKAVFSGADAIRTVINKFLVFEVICFLLYFIWMLYYAHREAREKQVQLDMVNYIYEVENLLFNAHVRPQNIAMALEKISQITSAQRVGFWIPGTEEENIAFVWDEKKKEMLREVSVSNKAIKALQEYFFEGNDEFEAYDAKNLHKIVPDGESVWIRNMMAVPAKDGKGGIRGILATCNMSRKWGNIALLKSVGVSFSMFCRNIRSYNIMRDKGEKDLLTGLYNRNRYERDCSRYKDWFQDSLACVYIDANGLHELNNSQGHEAGDRMLKMIAEQMRKRFGTQHTYRIGGDEFLAFAADQEETLVYHLGRETAEALEQLHIHISVGVRWKREVPSIQELVKEAEKEMYRSKKAYYEQEKNDRRKKRDF